MRSKDVTDGKRVNILVLVYVRDEGTQEDRSAICWNRWCKCVGRWCRQIRTVVNLRHESVSESSEVIESMLPRKSSKYNICKPYRKPTQVGGMNNPRRSRELWPRNSAK